MSGGWVRWDGAAVDAAVASAIMDGLHKTGERVVSTGAQNAPILLGDLRRSGTIADAPQEQAVYVGMGSGPSQPYAVVQHENTTLSHPRGGGAKYLERALDTEGRHLEQDVADALKAVM